ncbi:MAG: formamidopyrimidine-DNA glycosylase [Chloroflexales bacterium]|nr:formamidopyrimidine-DNA glycosylase [Chloroflexales bacterium]
MAEVPEVETLARDLCALVVGRRLSGARAPLPEAVRFPEPAAFGALVAGRRVEDANRRAKWLLCDLEGGVTLAMHMMLHGTLRLLPTGAPTDAQTMVVFGLDGGEELHLRDRKGFARVAAGPAAEVAARLRLDALGPELLDPAFDAAGLAARLVGRRGVLKTTLVDQKTLAGLGNRDADESLWEARIDPRRKAGSLTLDEIARLLAGARAVVEEGIALRGTMTDLRGVRGGARQDRKIYGHAGEPCPRCGTLIARTFLGQLITHYCPGCQV